MSETRREPPMVWKGMQLRDMTREQLEDAFCELGELYRRATMPRRDLENIQRLQRHYKISLRSNTN